MPRPGLALPGRGGGVPERGPGCPGASTAKRSSPQPVGPGKGVWGAEGLFLEAGKAAQKDSSAWPLLDE